jgi:hypothetical protein
LGDGYTTSGNFSEPIDNLISFMIPQDNRTFHFEERDYPWRRRAYDRTLSCPDLARVINDFLCADVEFVSNDSLPARLCA